MSPRAIYSVHSYLEIFTYLCVVSSFMCVLLSNITQVFGHPLVSTARDVDAVE